MSTKAAAKQPAKKKAKATEPKATEAKGKKAKAAAPQETEETPVSVEGSEEGAEGVEDADLDSDEGASGGQAAGNAAAIAAAGSAEMSASFKNFRHHPDMENFYRFIFENDLRHEALQLIDELIISKAEKKQGAKPAGKH